MKSADFTFKDDEGVEIFVYKWLPDDSTKIKGVVQIAHGMAETAARYERFAQALTGAGYIVYANDHRGHGRTAKTVENVGYTGKDGFNWMVRDMHQLNRMIDNENPGIPLYLFGHSMGSMLAQMYIALYGDTINGVVLSGTSGKQGTMINLGLMLSGVELKRIGPKGKSYTMNKLTFGSYNKEFMPARTEFDWLSRDEKEVDKYISDPFCGGVFTAQFFYDFLNGLKKMHKKETMEKIPKDLPIYIFSGDKDPVGKSGKGIMQLVNMYKELGIKNVTYKLYKDGRHETLNEINRDEVTADVIGWFEKH